MPLNLSPCGEAIDERRVECRSCNGTGYHDYLDAKPELACERCTVSWMDDCKGTGTIPDPALEPLHPILWEKHQHCGGKGYWSMSEVFMSGEQPRKYPCPICKGTGHTLRTAFWIAAGEGALAGRLGVIAKAFKNKYFNESGDLWQLWYSAYIACQFFGNQAALDAVTKAVQGMTKGGCNEPC